MKHAWIAFIVLASARAHAAVPTVPVQRVEPPGASDTEPLKGNVLVWSDATLYTEASDTAPALHASALEKARKDSAGEVVPMRVVSIQKAFVEVEPAAELDCTWSRLQTTDDVAKLHLFVKRTDLAPVVTAPIEKSFENGSRVALRPGVAVVPTADGKYVIGMRGAEIVVELPANSVGHAYTPDKAKPPAALSDREYVVAPRTAVTVGDRSFALDGVRAQSIEPRGPINLFQIRSRCISVDAIAPVKAVKSVDEDETDIDPGSSFGVMDLRDHDYIPMGTPLSTPSGKFIAAAAKPIYLTSAPHGKTACIDRKIRVGIVGVDSVEPTDGDNRLRLCAPAGRVIHEHVRSASSANGTTQR